VELLENLGKMHAAHGTRERAEVAVDESLDGTHIV
jgi:hypothetical protein